MSERQPGAAANETAQLLVYGWYGSFPESSVAKRHRDDLQRRVALALEDFAAQAVKDAREEDRKAWRKFQADMREANDAPQ